MNRTLMTTSLLLLSCLTRPFLFASSSAGLTQKSQASTAHHWKLLIVRPQFKFTIIDPVSNTKQNTRIIANGSANKNLKIIRQKIAAPSCISANYPTRTVLCQSASGSTLFNFDNGAPIKDHLKSYGPISPDGRYIVDEQGRNVLDLKTMKTILAHDPLWSPGNGSRIYSKSGVGIEILSHINGNDNFLVKTIDEKGNQLNVQLLYKANLKNIVARHGKNIRLIIVDSNQSNSSNETFRNLKKYRLKNGTLLVPLFNTSKKIKWSIKTISDSTFNSLQSRNLFAGLCNVTADDSWAICWVPKKVNTKEVRAIIYNIKLNRISRIKVPVGQALWLWTGQPERHP